jgi:transcriptional regulator GlxA family with amidase domain
MFPSGDCFWSVALHHPFTTLNIIKPILFMKRKDTQLIQEIIVFIDDHLYEQHTIPGLCSHFNVNREKLQLGFHELVNSTVHAYIIQQRIQRAAERLLQSDDSIKRVALDSGYKKQRSFNKTFKSIFKLTPAKYRSLHQQREER